MDHFCHSVRYVASRNGDILHAGWIHPHSAGPGHCRGVDPPYSRANPGLRAVAAGAVAPAPANAISGMRSSKPAVPTAAPYLPRHPTVEKLRAAATGCRGCHLWEQATQTVFGEGHPGLAVMLVGEQPGDQEDRHGHPFVGPAGRILNFALEKAGIDRSQVYVTNAVSISSSNHVESDESIKNQTCRKFARAGPGWKRRSTWFNPRSSSVLERQRRSPCWARNSASRNPEDGCCRLRSVRRY